MVSTICKRRDRERNTTDRNFVRKFGKPYTRNVAPHAAFDKGLLFLS